MKIPLAHTFIFITKCKLLIEIRKFITKINRQWIFTKLAPRSVFHCNTSKIDKKQGTVLFSL